MPAPQPDQVPGEPVEVAHMAVGTVQPIPPDQAVGAMRIIGP